MRLEVAFTNLNILLHTLRKADCTHFRAIFYRLHFIGSDYSIKRAKDQKAYRARHCLSLSNTPPANPLDNACQMTVSLTMDSFLNDVADRNNALIEDSCLNDVVYSKTFQRQK